MTARLQKKLIFIVALSFGLGVISATAKSATIAIIDSGTDMKHREIAPQAWININEIPGNNRDDDRNGYQDDVHGWNFAEGNNQVIDYKYLGIFNDDIDRFFEIQTKAMMGTMTPEEREWIIAKIEDQEFIKQITIFGNFMHGTHVGHIGIRGAPEAELMAVKLIPTEVNLPFFYNPGVSKENQVGSEEDKSLRMRLLKKGLEFLANQQMEMMDEIAAYVASHKADIANGSFGTGYPQASMIVEVLFKNVLRKDPTEAELHEATTHFLNALVSRGQQMVALAPETLFVFASGNDGLDNDVFPTSPTNIEANNVISVGATIGYGDLAVFSNFGKKTVDVLAPGVGVRAAIPGDEYIRVSGTSQAAPYVASVAAHLKSLNPNLTPAQIKQILMGTVDVRPELAEKVRTSGLVNRSRATRAAELSTSVAISDAISESRLTVADLPIEKSYSQPSAGAKNLVLPLPSVFR